MSLSVKLENDTTHVSYFLKASDWQFSYSRTITSVPLPGGTVFQMDLSMTQPSIKVSGTCDMTGTGGSGGIARKDDFDTVLTWYSDTILLYENSSKSYAGKIRSINFRRDPAWDYFTFDLEFLVNPTP